MPKLHSQKPLNRWTTNAASSCEFWRTGKLPWSWALASALRQGGHRWALCLLPVVEPQLSCQSAADLEENPSLSLLHLCLSHQTTATTEQSFPFSCEHLPANASHRDDSRNHKHGKEDTGLISLPNNSSHSCWQSDMELQCSPAVAPSFDLFTLQHSSHEQPRGGSCSQTAFPFVKGSNSFGADLALELCTEMVIPNQTEIKDLSKWIWTRAWPTNTSQSWLGQLAEQFPARADIHSSLSQSVEQGQCLLNSQSLCTQTLVSTASSTLSHKKPCSECLHYKTQCKSHCDTVVHLQIPQSQSALMPFQVWDYKKDSKRDDFQAILSWTKHHMNGQHQWSTLQRKVKGKNYLHSYMNNLVTLKQHHLFPSI